MFNFKTILFLVVIVAIIALAQAQFCKLLLKAFIFFSPQIQVWHR